MNVSLYGFRDSAVNWEETYSGELVDGGCKKGKASPCLSTHDRRGIRMLVHGDDFFASGPEGSSRWLKTLLSQRFEIKAAIVGAREELSRTMTVLNRQISWGKDGITWEADTRHA